MHRIYIGDAIRHEAWELLRQMGLVTASTPPNPPRGKQPTLRLVEPKEGSGTPDSE